jgi:hypothetical protein
MNSDSNRNDFIKIIVFACLMWMITAIPVIGAPPEYILDKNTATDVIKKKKEPLKESFEDEEKKPSIAPGLKGKLAFEDPFWRDTHINVRIRSYYFDRNIGGDTENLAWTIGGWIDYKSGYYKNRFQIGAAPYTSQPLYAPDDKDGTGLLESGQEGITILGQAYLAFRITDGVDIRVFRQPHNVPYLNENDSRMIPNTFESYALRGSSFNKTDFIAAQITKIKERDSNEFVHMSEAAGFEGTSKPVTMGGIRYSFTEDINAGAITQYGWDLWNTLYLEANGYWNFIDKFSIRLSAQYTDQRSVGEEIGGSFQTGVFGGKIAFGYKGAGLSLAFSSTDDERKIQNPWGGYPGYISLMLSDFNRAGEEAWLVAASYDFGELGFEGLSVFTKYARGYNAEGIISGSAVEALPDQEEFDITLDYRLKKGPLKNLWLRFRYAFLNQDGPGAVDSDNIRLILNYDVPIL